MANILTRAYNSTLGVPQQAIYRLWRALKDEDIDVFSREGLLAPELLPVLGMAFSHETDVQVEELIGDQGGFANFAADVLMDPATYLTAGASALGKGSKALRMAGRHKKEGAEFLKYIGDTAQYEKASDLASKISQGIGEGVLKGKAPEKALQALGEVPDELVEKILKSGRDEESLFSIPGLSFLGAKWRAPELIQNQGSWFKAMTNLVYKQKLGLSKPIDWTIAQSANMIRRIPGGEGLTNAVNVAAGLPATFKAGFTKFKGSKNVIKLGEAVTNPSGWDQEYGHLGRLFQDVDVEKLQDDIELAVAEGLSGMDAAKKAAKQNGVPAASIEALMELNQVGADNFDPMLDFGAGVRGVQEQHKVAQAAMEKSKANPYLTDRFKVPEQFANHPFSAWMYKAGDYMGEFARKTFRSDVPIDSERLSAFAKKRENLEALTDMAANDTLRIFDKYKRNIAKDNGIEMEVVDRFWMNWQQAFPHSSEVKANLDALRSGDLSNAAAGGRQFDDYLNRLDASLQSIFKLGGDHAGLKEWTDILGEGGVKRVLGPSAEHIKLVAADVTDSKAVKDLLRKPVGNMSPDDIKRLRVVAKDPVLKARLKHIEKRFRKGKKANTEEAISRVIGKARVSGVDEAGKKFSGKPTEGMQAAAADYIMATRDIKRALTRSRRTGEPVRIAPGTVARIQQAEQALQGGLKELAQGVFKKSKAEDVEGLIGLSDKVANSAAKISGFERGAVIGYAPRLYNRKFRAELGRLVGKAENILGGPSEVGSLFARTADRDLILEDLNQLKMALLEADQPDVWKEIVDLFHPKPKKGASAADEAAHLTKVKEFDELTDQPYVDSWETGILTRMSQQGREVATREFVNDVFSNPEAAAQDGIIGGRITRLFDADNVPVESGATRIKVGGKQSATLGRTPVEGELKVAAAEVQLTDGTYQIVDLAQYKRRFGDNGIQVLGKEGGDLGEALVRHEGRAGGRVTNTVPEVGAWMVGGEGGVIDWIKQSAVPQKSEMAGILGAYDAVNFTVKKFQTVFRASHHFGNLISGIAQTRAAGASWSSTVKGHIEAARFLGIAGENGARAIDDMSAVLHTGEASWNPLRKMQDRVHIIEGLIAGKTIDELGEFAVISNGLEQYGAGEIMQRAVAGNVFGGMQSRADIQLGGIDPQSVLKQQERLRGGKFTRATDQALDASRYPEIGARTATLMALWHDGHSLDDAIAMTKAAHVDYSSLTKRERHVLKRAMPYYTFSRKYVPFALERMAKDPALIVGWQKAVEHAEWAGIDENGTPVISAGAFEADLGRMNANLDSMMALAGLTEVLTGTVGNEIQSVSAPGFLNPSGGALSPLMAAAGFNSDEGASLPAGLGELWDSVFVTRFLEGASDLAQGEGGQKLGDSALSWLVPAQFNAEPDKARQFQLNLARRAMRRLELQAKETSNPKKLASLRRQAQEVQNAVQTVQQDFGN